MKNSLHSCSDSLNDIKESTSNNLFMENINNTHIQCWKLRVLIDFNELYYKYNKKQLEDSVWLKIRDINSNNQTEIEVKNNASNFNDNKDCYRK